MEKLQQAHGNPTTTAQFSHIHLLVPTGSQKGLQPKRLPPPPPPREKLLGLGSYFQGFSPESLPKNLETRAKQGQKWIQHPQNRGLQCCQPLGPPFVDLKAPTWGPGEGASENTALERLGLGSYFQIFSPKPPLNWETGANQGQKWIQHPQKGGLAVFPALGIHFCRPEGPRVGSRSQCVHARALLPREPTGQCFEHLTASPGIEIVTLVLPNARQQPGLGHFPCGQGRR